MTLKAVLLDLDDTLIRNPTEHFLSRYFALVDAHFSRLWGDAPYASILATGARQVMHGERDMLTSNFRVIINAVAAQTGLEVGVILTALNTFYSTAYQELRACVEPVDGAGTLVTALRDSGYAVVIATNPVYPLEAIRQRLAWGGLPDQPADYAFITSAENMHFAKPNPAYYAEILARVGVEPDEAVMIGDSVENDITAAESLGMHTIQVQPGALSTVLAALTDIEAAPPLPLKPAMIAPQWRGNIGALYGLLDTARPHFWNQHPDPAEWSPNQILCHLLEHEGPVHRDRLKHILETDNPFIAAPPPPPGPDAAATCGGDGPDIAAKFTAARRETLALIATLPPEAWARPARHSIFGPTTLLEMAHFTAQHDRLHLHQLCQTLGGCA